MAGRRVPYDQIAATYNQRFVANRREGTAVALLDLAQSLGAKRILEVGCGTGRWLADLHSLTPHVYGLDLSAEMLRQARKRPDPLLLVQGQAENLAFSDAVFDFVYCVNAIHHFDDPRLFVSEARRLLRPGGALAVVGMDPRDAKSRSYLYRYFRGTYETDLKRFPSWGTVLDWMAKDGFGCVACRQLEHIHARKVGREVLSDPFLQKNACSQLALLTQDAYDDGLRRIRTALSRAEAAGETIVFETDIPIAMLIGYV
jgi:ubiquinone/menaquinone biosynthesis C-methylase UbiE